MKLLILITGLFLGFAVGCIINVASKTEDNREIDNQREINKNLLDQLEKMTKVNEELLEQLKGASRK